MSLQFITYLYNFWKNSLVDIFQYILYSFVSFMEV